MNKKVAKPKRDESEGTLQVRGIHIIIMTIIKVYKIYRTVLVVVVVVAVLSFSIKESHINDFHPQMIIRRDETEKIFGES